MKRPINAVALKRKKKESNAGKGSLKSNPNINNDEDAMQQVTLTREIISNKAVLGKMKLNDEIICYTLENPWLYNEPFVSCIPAGKYIAKKYHSKKYPNVWEIQAVKDRSKILIHAGNLEKDTSGCILVGSSWGFLSDQLAVVSSKVTLINLREILDDEFEIEII